MKDVQGFILFTFHPLTSQTLNKDPLTILRQMNERETRQNLPEPEMRLWHRASEEAWRNAYQVQSQRNQNH